MTQSWSGGCQCGAIRYRFTVRPSSAHLCHCRMCQKAFGAFYAPLVGGPVANFELTRGTLTTFMSSDLAERGFCAKCGTPLSFRYVDGQWISVSIGSLDDPESFPPKSQHGIDARLSYASSICTLPDESPIEERASEKALAIKSSNHQHPDHDTANWPEPR